MTASVVWAAAAAAAAATTAKLLAWLVSITLLLYISGPLHTYQDPSTSVNVFISVLFIFSDGHIGTLIFAFSFSFFFSLFFFFLGANYYGFGITLVYLVWQTEATCLLDPTLGPHFGAFISDLLFLMTMIWIFLFHHYLDKFISFTHAHMTIPQLHVLDTREGNESPVLILILMFLFFSLGVLLYNLNRAICIDMTTFLERLGIPSTVPL